ncbi:MAG: c-type cytochrome [Gemmatimonadota bacterium]|jgi:mono/diheme cytochrome c family protein
MQRFLTRSAGALSVVLLAACGGGASDAAPPAEQPAETTEPAAAAPAMAMTDLPEGVTPEMIAEGKTIFEDPALGMCSTCHGVDAKGTTLAPDLTDEEWLHVTGRNYDEIVNLIMTGVPQPTQHPSPMPPKGGSSITDDQVRAVAAYVWSLGTH